MLSALHERLRILEDSVSFIYELSFKFKIFLIQQDTLNVNLEASSITIDQKTGDLSELNE